MKNNNILPLKTPLCLNTSPSTKSVHINLIREREKRERTLYLVESQLSSFFKFKFYDPKASLLWQHWELNYSDFFFLASLSVMNKLISGNKRSSLIELPLIVWSLLQCIYFNSADLFNLDLVCTKNILHYYIISNYYLGQHR